METGQFEEHRQKISRGLEQIQDCITVVMAIAGGMQQHRGAHGISIIKMLSGINIHGKE